MSETQKPPDCEHSDGDQIWDGDETEVYMGIKWVLAGDARLIDELLESNGPRPGDAELRILEARAAIEQARADLDYALKAIFMGTHPPEPPTEIRLTA